MELFHQFHPLFLEQLNAGSIGLCRWLEAGTSVETALPELYTKYLIECELNLLEVPLDMTQERGTENVTALVVR